MKALRVVVPREHEDWASAVLWEHGTEGIEVREDGTFADLLAYFAEAALPAEIATALLAVPGARIEPAEVPQVDWLERFRQGFRGFDAGSFHVAPVWDVPDDRHRQVLVVDPGRAFGTGTHETTRLCLRVLEERAHDPQGLGRLLDVGTGTGILAIAGRRLGASLAVGVDIDPESLEAAGRHRELNGEAVLLVQGDGVAAFRAASFDTVVANVSAPLLLRLRDDLLRVAGARGAIVLSGLLVTDLPEVRAAYAEGGAFDQRTDGEWAALVIRKEA